MTDHREPFSPAWAPTGTTETARRTARIERQMDAWAWDAEQPDRADYADLEERR